MHRFPVLSVLLVLAGCVGLDPSPGVPAARTSPSVAAPGVAADPGGGRWSRLEAAVRARIEEASPGEVAVVVLDLEDGGGLAVDGDVEMHAASTMKVPVLLELFRQAGSGHLRLDDSLVVKTEFRSLADGSLYALSAADDSDPELYDRVGSRVTLRELARRMTVRSSNLATNLLIERITADSVMRTLDRLGASGMRVLRGVEDGPAYRRGLNNTTTAAGYARVLESIARCELLGPSACGEVVEILAAQEFRRQIPAGVPSGVRVANKTGWITGIHHDGAIIYPPGRAPYVLVVLTRGIRDREVSERVAADISRLVWDALVPGGAGTAAVASPPRPQAGLPGATAERVALHDRHRSPALTRRKFTHREYWSVLGPIVDGAAGLKREEIGRSAEGRPLWLVRYGRGPTTVLLWSQMHGDESTATMALLDLFKFLAEAPDDPRARLLAERLTVLAIPMLNPDAAGRFQRRNSQGIDVNRDARSLVTPEARALKSVRDRYRPDFGFNLHDQNVRTRVGSSERLAAIALLAPPPDATGREPDGLVRAMRVAATIREAVEPLVAGHISRYDDTFNPRAFGDLMQAWGTSTVLVESGGWRGDPEKQYLRMVNFVGLLAALEAIATGGYAEADLALYRTLPPNGRAVNDVVLVGGTVVVPGLPPYRADITVNFADPLARTGSSIVDIGDLPGALARDTIDATGLFIHPSPSALRAQADGPAFLAPGSPADFVIRRGADPDSPVVQVIRDGVATPPSRVSQ